MNLRRRISFFLIMLSVVAVAATTFFVLRIAVTDKKNYVTELNSALVPQITYSLDFKIKDLKLSLDKLAFDLKKNAPMAVSAFKTQHQGIDALYFISPDNKISTFALNAQKLDEINLAGDNLYQNKNVFFIKTGEINVAILPNENFFHDSFLLARGKPSVFAFNGVPVFKSGLTDDLEALLKKIPAELTSRSEIISTEVENDGKNYLVNFNIIPALESASVILAAPQPTWRDLAEPIIKSAAGILTLLIVFSILIAYSISHSLAKPLEELTELTSKVGRGEWQKIELTGTGTEILKLTAAFNRMTDNLKKREHDLKIAQNKIIQSESLAAVGRMSAGIAHEVKNPLSSILGYGQLIERKMASDPAFAKIQEYIKLILEDTRRASKIISDLLTFSRQKSLQTETKALPQLANELSHKLKAFCETHNIDFKSEIHVPENTCVQVDSEQIYQVIFNLVQNACQALNESSTLHKSITFSVKSSESAAELQITDNGPGIAEENIKKIFEPFFSTKKVGEGTGLGLALCYGIIQQHGGTIEVSSKPGETHFLVKLPC